MNARAYHAELLGIYALVSDAKKSEFANRFSLQAKNPVVIFGFGCFLGTLGVDRFLLGQTGLGILKLITFGGFGLWTLIDLFLVAGIARDKNIEMARQIQASI